MAGPETPERRYRPSIRQVQVRGERQIRRGLSAITSSAASTPVRYAPT
jgi:hypothetical protein